MRKERFAANALKWMASYQHSTAARAPRTAPHLVTSYQHSTAAQAPRTAPHLVTGPASMDHQALWAGAAFASPSYLAAIRVLCRRPPCTLLEASARNASIIKGMSGRTGGRRRTIACIGKCVCPAAAADVLQRHCRWSRGGYSTVGCMPVQCHMQSLPRNSGARCIIKKGTAKNTSRVPSCQ